jgi:hypothetical protein
MAHIVKCAICGANFDRDNEQAVRHGARRYSHATCEPDNKDFVPLVEKKPKKIKAPKKEVNPDAAALDAYIYSLFGDKTNWAMVKKQIKKYQEEEGYSLTGILKSLIYFYEVQHNSIDKSNYAIGIVPFCYGAAKEYYYNLWLAQQQNQDKVFQAKEKEVVIKAPRKPEMFKRFFDLGESE